MITVSYSEIDAYLKCPENHYWGYVRRLTTKKPVKPLYFGSDMHKLLQHRGNRANVKAAIHEIKETFNDNIDALGDDYLDNLKFIWADYNQQWKNEPLPDETEHRFEVQIGSRYGEPIYLVGVIDELYGKERLGEHKTFSREPSLMSLILTVQPALYAKAREMETGVMPRWIQWDHIKSTSAVAPVWLEKSQRFSGAKTTKTTEWSYLRACRERGIDPDPMLVEAYRNNNGAFFFRTPVEINRYHVYRVFEDFKETAKAVVNKGSTDRRHRYGRDCSWCKFQPLCYAQYSGLNVEELIKSDYKEKEKHDAEEPEDSGND